MSNASFALFLILCLLVDDGSFALFLLLPFDKEEERDTWDAMTLSEGGEGNGMDM